MRKIAQFLTAVALGVAALGAQAQINNGSFEATQNIDGTNRAFGSGDVWGYINSPKVSNPPSGIEFVQAHDGNQYANLGNDTGIYSNWFQLAAGQYLLSFYSLGSGTSHFTNGAGNVLLSSESFTSNSSGWTLNTHAFTVNSFSDFRVRFTTSPSQTALIDSVGITTAVPEPETYAMMLAGLGAIGFLSRRRKQAA